MIFTYYSLYKATKQFSRIKNNLNFHHQFFKRYQTPSALMLKTIFIFRTWTPNVGTTYQIEDQRVPKSLSSFSLQIRFVKHGQGGGLILCKQDLNTESYQLPCTSQISWLFRLTSGILFPQYLPSTVQYLKKKYMCSLCSLFPTTFFDQISPNLWPK